MTHTTYTYTEEAHAALIARLEDLEWLAWVVLDKLRWHEDSGEVGAPIADEERIRRIIGYLPPPDEPPVVEAYPQEPRKTLDEQVKAAMARHDANVAAGKYRGREG